ncbi:MAG TPA: hypothetical protein VIT66_09200 [Lysobacter sp.]
MIPSRRDIAPSLTDRAPIDRTIDRTIDSTIDSTPITPTLEGLLHYAIAIGAVLVVLLPAARGFSDTFGWMPLWLLAMPLSAWWALHRFRLPGFSLSEPAQPRAVTVSSRRRRPGTQARRRAMPSPRRDIASRAA